mgnify:CR=1 FL=1
MKRARRPASATMRRLFRLLDAVLHRISGNYAFCDDAGCLLRLRRTPARHAMKLPGTTIHRGEPVLELHVWNQHVPPMPADGASLAWALDVRRMLSQSLQLVAGEMLRDPVLAGIRAVGGDSVMVDLDGTSGSRKLMERLGFTVMAYQGSLSRFTEFWKNLHAWMLMWTYSPASLQHRGPLDLQRSEVWMTSADFLECYGPSKPQQQKAPDGAAAGPQQGQAAASTPSQVQRSLP